VCDVSSLDDLKMALDQYPDAVVIGKGSNSLINPDKVAHVIRLMPDMFSSIYQDGVLSVCAGRGLAGVMKDLQTFSCTGLEFAAGVPATIGGMVVMNFGCWGVEVKDILNRVLVMDRTGREFYLDGAQCEFSYRSSVFQKKDWIVLAADFNCPPGSLDDIKKKIADNIALRLEKQPLRAKTFGSTFRNPDGHYAGALIEEVGLKGNGGEHVKWSEKHANFLVNTGKATFQDAMECINDTQAKVKDATGINLDLEVKIIS